MLNHCVSCIGTVIKNYFKIFNASYTPLLFYMNLYVIFVYCSLKLSMCYWKTELAESYQGLLEFYSG